MTKPLLQLFGVGRELVQSQTATASALQSSTNGVEDGEVVSTTLATGNNTVSHRLGRVPTGAILVAGDAAESVVLVSGTATTAVVVASGAVSGAKVLVF